MSSGPLWQGSGTQLTSLVDLLPEHEGDCMEACPLGTGAGTHDGGMHVDWSTLLIV